MRWSREEYIELMTFGKESRPMFVELFGPLIGLEDEWIKQGATTDEIELTAFDFDYVPHIGCGGNAIICNGLTPYVIEETAKHKIYIDTFGRKSKLCKGFATLPLPMEYPVKDEESWLKIKHWFEYNEGRIDWNAVEAAKAAQKNGTLTLANIHGGFDLPRELFGDEELCYAYYDQPELIEDILNTMGDTALKVLDRVSDKLLIDNLIIHEDMAGKFGPIIGPAMVTQFLKPYYRKIWDMLSSKGTKLFSQDSDGNMNAIIDEIMDCGVNIMYPAEPAAGMDIVELRKKYGTKLAFKGGIDKHVLRQDKEAIRKELEYKLQPLMQQGGVAFGIDHRITNGTTIENYRYYVDTAREILGLPPRKSKGWGRMAF